MSRLVLILALVGLVVVSTPASAEYVGSCINHRGTLGISVTVSHCLATVNAERPCPLRPDCD